MDFFGLSKITLRENFGEIVGLGPEGWFIWDESKTNCLWTPAPVGVETAVEEIANWIHHTPEQRIHVRANGNGS